MSFGLAGPADVTARIDRLDGSGTRFRLHGFDREAAVTLRPVGTRALSHALAAAALAWSHGLPLEAQAATTDRRRRAVMPTTPKPATSSAHDAGSGTAPPAPVRNTPESEVKDTPATWPRLTLPVCV